MTKLFFALVVLIGFMASSFTYARGKRVKAAPTVENEVSSCRENQNGMAIITRNALYKSNSPLADRIDSIQWPKFCDCFGPKHLQLSSTITPEFKKQSDWFQKYEEKRNTIAVECAVGSAGAVAQKLPISTPSPGNDAKFASFIGDCASNSKGRLMNVQIHLESQKNPRASRVFTMNPKKYCACHVASLRRDLGDELALRELFGTGMTPDADLVKVRKAVNSAYESCAAEQLEF